MALSALANLLGTYMIRPVVNSLAAGSQHLVLGVAVTAAIYGAGASALGYTQIMVKAAQKVLTTSGGICSPSHPNPAPPLFDTQRHGDVMFTSPTTWTSTEALNNSFAMLIQSTIQVVGTFTMLFHSIGSLPSSWR